MLEKDTQKHTQEDGQKARVQNSSLGTKITISFG